MNRVYAVKINGRTLESRNIRELLARAVSVKRNPDQRMKLKTEYFGQTSALMCRGLSSIGYGCSALMRCKRGVLRASTTEIPCVS